MLHQIVFALLLALLGVKQCHSFKLVKRKSALPMQLMNYCNSQYRCIRYRSTHYSSPLHPVFKLRGGNENEYDDDREEEEDNEEGQYDDTMYEFVSSFESELAEIRREAEMEAEEEMQKLRGLIERRGNVEEENDGPDYNEVVIDGSKEVDEEEVSASDNEPASQEVIDEEQEEEDHQDEQPDGELEEETEQPEIETQPEITEQTEIDSEKVLNEDETSEVIDQSEVESAAEDEDLEINEPGDTVDSSQQEESDATIDLDESIDDSDESTSEMIELDATTELSLDSTSDQGERANYEIQQDDLKPKKKKSKKKKKKGKASKKGKKRVSRIQYEEDSDLSDGDVVEMGDSVMLTTGHDDIEETPQTGILGFLRSDLGRALCMFSATVALALLTTRLQRQLEAQGN